MSYTRFSKGPLKEYTDFFMVYTNFINGIQQFYEWNITLLCMIYNNNTICIYHIYQWNIIFF